MITLPTPQQFTLGVLGAAFLSLGTGSSAQAAVLFNNGAPDLKSAVRSDFSFPIEAGDNFTFTSSNDIKAITWSGIYANSTTLAPASRPAADDFSIRVFSLLQDTSGTKTPAIDPLMTFNPGGISRTNSGTQIPGASNGYDIYNYTFNLTKPFTLGAGDYLLSIVNNTNQSNDDWFWATSSQTGNDFGRSKPGQQWFSDSNQKDLSFAIYGNATPSPPTSPPAPSPNPVPTPALLPGLIGFGLSLWRKRRSTVSERSTEMD